MGWSARDREHACLGGGREGAMAYLEGSCMVFGYPMLDERPRYLQLSRGMNNLFRLGASLKPHNHRAAKISLEQEMAKRLGISWSLYLGLGGTGSIILSSWYYSDWPTRCNTPQPLRI